MAKKKSSFADKRIPLYYQVENVLREKISSGAFQDGDQMPTELALIKEFGVSRITIRQALKALADDGLIERKQGRGTYITERKTKKRAFSGTTHLTGSLDELIAMGLDTHVKVLEMNKIEADAHEAELLQLPLGESIYRLKRLRIHDDEPYALIINYLPEKIGNELNEKELASGALLQTLESKLGYKLHMARQEIKAEMADPYIAKLLGVRVGTALLSIERTVYTEEGKPIEYVYTAYRSDVYGYSVKFVREDNDS